MTTKAKLFKWSRKIHKWTGLVLGIQLLLWILGGVVMSALPRDMVIGDHVVNREANQPKSPLLYSASIDAIIAGLDGEVENISFTHRLGQPAVKVNTTEKEFWFDGHSGDRLAPLDEAQARRIAAAYYQGDGELLKATLLNELPLEMRRRKTPMWQVVFDDSIDTTLYITPENGRLVRVRSDIWRFYDFFWMLHIMDYDERSDSHNLLLIIFSVFATIFALSGVILFFQVFKKRDFFGKRKALAQPLKS